MYLKQLEIEGFKSFKKSIFDFHPKINIFTGVNNAGKTTVLEAIALWYECYQKLLNQASKSEKGLYQQGDYIIGSKTPTYVSYQDINSVRSPNYQDIFSNLITDPLQPIILRAVFKSYNSADELTIPIRLSKSEGDNYRLACDDFKKFNFKLLNDKNFLKEPEGIQLTYTSPVANVLAIEEQHLVAKVNFLRKSRASAQVLRNRLRLLKSRSNGDFDRFVSELKNILTNNKENIDFDFSTDAHKLREVVKVKIGGDIFKDISLLGSGTLQIIEILLSLFEDYKELNLILLDEPDSHIHHLLQKRLLRTLKDFSTNGQVFLTTHNESLIRTAQPEWVFHLEQPPQAHYKPILAENLHLNHPKKGFLQSVFSPIILNLTGSNTLDFVQALEADKLLLVEGSDDAQRIQQLLNIKTNNAKKYAFWAAGGVDSYFSQLSTLKTIFGNIKNSQSLWQKSILIMDKDDATDAHRSKIMEGFKNKLGIETHIWASYNFESILLSDFDKLSELLLLFINSKNVKTTILHDAQVIKQHIEKSIAQNLNEIKKTYKDEKELDQLFGKFKNRRTLISEKHSAIQLKNVFEEDKDLKRALERYYETCFTVNNIHKICRKTHLEQILKNVLQLENIDFQLETGFDELFSFINNSSLFFDEYNFLLNI